VTDAEMFIVIRDLCVAYRGSWSANLVLAIAQLLGAQGRRASLISDIQSVCGASGKRGGKRMALTGTRDHALTGTRTGTATGTRTPSGTSTATGSREKEKNQKKKSTGSTPPSDTSCPPAPQFDAETEADLTAFLAVVAAGNLSGTISAGREATLRRQADTLLIALGSDALRYGLREATSRDKTKIEYAAACAKSFAQKRDGATGTGRSTATGTPTLFSRDELGERELVILDPPYEPPTEPEKAVV